MKDPLAGMVEGELSAHLAMRLQNHNPDDPLSAVGLPPQAGLPQIKQAFRDAIKTYNPQRFAHYSKDVQRLANEFYTQLQSALREVLATGNRARGTGTMPATSTNAALRARARGSRAGAPSTQPMPQSASAGIYDVQALITVGRYAEALAALHQLNGSDPTNRDYKVYLCYAKGLQKQAVGMLRDAAREYKNALALDPNFTPARDALQSVEVEAQS